MEQQFVTDSVWQLLKTYRFRQRQTLSGVVVAFVRFWRHLQASWLTYMLCTCLSLVRSPC